MIDRVFWSTIIIFFIGTFIYIIYGLNKLDDKIANCKGLVVKTTDGWVCSTAQKAE